jgi:hypothetical protein
MNQQERRTIERELLAMRDNLLADFEKLVATAEQAGYSITTQYVIKDNAPFLKVEIIKILENPA